MEEAGSSQPPGRPRKPVDYSALNGGDESDGDTAATDADLNVGDSARDADYDGSIADGGDGLDDDAEEEADMSASAAYDL